jgi:hypothetical protein
MTMTSNRLRKRKLIELEAEIVSCQDRLHEIEWDRVHTPRTIVTPDDRRRVIDKIKHLRREIMDLKLAILDEGV